SASLRKRPKVLRCRETSLCAKSGRREDFHRIPMRPFLRCRPWFSVGRLRPRAARPWSPAAAVRDHLDQNRPTFRLLPTLVMSIVILFLLRVVSVLILIGLADRRIVQKSTPRLIARTLSAEGRALRAHLDAAVNQGDFIAAAIGSGRFQFGEPA